MMIVTRLGLSRLGGERDRGREGANLLGQSRRGRSCSMVQVLAGWMCGSIRSSEDRADGRSRVTAPR